MKKLFLLCLSCFCLVSGCASNRQLIIPTPPQPYNIEKIENNKDHAEATLGFSSFSKESMYYINTVYRIKYGVDYYYLITNENGYREWVTLEDLKK